MRALLVGGPSDGQVVEPLPHPLPQVIRTPNYQISTIEEPFNPEQPMPEPNNYIRKHYISDGLVLYVYEVVMESRFSRNGVRPMPLQRTLVCIDCEEAFDNQEEAYLHAHMNLCERKQNELDYKTYFTFRLNGS